MHTGAARDSDSFHMFSFPFSDWERERERKRDSHAHRTHKICWDTAVTNDTYFAMKIGSPFDGWAAINRRSQMLPKQMKEMLGCRRWA